MLSLTLLGTGAACPTVDRNVASLAIHREGEMLLFDCGEGTQRQMMRYGVGFSFDEIFFSHFHADHFLGLSGLLRTLGLLDRKAPLALYGPKGAEKWLGQAVALGMDRPKFPVEVQELKPGAVLKRAEYDIHAFPVDHRGEAFGYALIEHERLGRFHPDRAKEFGVPEGPLWGKLHKGETVTLPDGRKVAPADLVGAPRPGRRVVYTGDTRPCRSVVEAAKGADLLVHEATFGEEERDRAKETGHSTAREAAEVAERAGVKKLLLTHISARYTREAPELAAEARAVFPEAEVGRDGMSVEVPFET
ncbi:MAG TPA: ribonuclease Z [Gemmatimonadales bacterium]|nr:ribonuclease Z [Gemmatimonadales bacterium]